MIPVRLDFANLFRYKTRDIINYHPEIPIKSCKEKGQNFIVIKNIWLIKDKLYFEAYSLILKKTLKKGIKYPNKKESNLSKYYRYRNYDLLFWIRNITKKLIRWFLFFFFFAILTYILNYYHSCKSESLINR